MCNCHFNDCWRNISKLNVHLFNKCQTLPFYVFKSWYMQVFCEDMLNKNCIKLLKKNSTFVVVIFVLKTENIVAIDLNLN